MDARHSDARRWHDYLRASANTARITIPQVDAAPQRPVFILDDDSPIRNDYIAVDPTMYTHSYVTDPDTILSEESYRRMINERRISMERAMEQIIIDDMETVAGIEGEETSPHNPLGEKMFKINDTVFITPGTIRKNSLVWENTPEEEVDAFIEIYKREMAGWGHPKRVLENIDEFLKQMILDGKMRFTKPEEMSDGWVHMVYRQAGNNAFPKYNIYATCRRRRLFTHDAADLYYYFFDDNLDEKNIINFPARTCHIHVGSPCYGDNKDNIRASSVSLPDYYLSIKTYLDSLYRGSQYNSEASPGTRIAWMAGIMLPARYDRTLQLIEDYHKKMTPVQIRQKLEDAIELDNVTTNKYHEYIREQTNKSHIYKFLATGNNDTYHSIHQPVQKIAYDILHGQWRSLGLAERPDLRDAINNHIQLIRPAFNQSQTTLNFIRKIELQPDLKKAKKFIDSISKAKSSEITDAEYNQFKESFEKTIPVFDYVFNNKMELLGNGITELAKAATEIGRLNIGYNSNK